MAEKNRSVVGLTYMCSGLGPSAERVTRTRSETSVTVSNGSNDTSRHPLPTFTRFSPMGALPTIDQEPVAGEHLPTPARALPRPCQRATHQQPPAKARRVVRKSPHGFTKPLLFSISGIQVSKSRSCSLTASFRIVGSVMSTRDVSIVIVDRRVLGRWKRSPPGSNGTHGSCRCTSLRFGFARVVVAIRSRPA